MLQKARPTKGVLQPAPPSQQKRQQALAACLEAAHRLGFEEGTPQQAGSGSDLAVLACNYIQAAGDLSSLEVDPGLCLSDSSVCAASRENNSLCLKVRLDQYSFLQAEIEAKQDECRYGSLLQLPVLKHKVRKPVPTLLLHDCRSRTRLYCSTLQAGTLDYGDASLGFIADKQVWLAEQGWMHSLLYVPAVLISIVE